MCILIRNIFVSLCSSVRSECSSGVQLVIGHLPSLPFGAHPAGYEEIYNKRCFLSQCVCALKVSNTCTGMSTLCVHCICLYYTVSAILKALPMSQI